MGHVDTQVPRPLLAGPGLREASKAGHFPLLASLPLAPPPEAPAAVLPHSSSLCLGSEVGNTCLGCPPPTSASRGCFPIPWCSNNCPLYPPCCV